MIVRRRMGTLSNMIVQWAYSKEYLYSPAYLQILDPTCVQENDYVYVNRFWYYFVAYRKDYFSGKLHFTCFRAVRMLRESYVL
jgi:hypothetical protein